MLRLLAIDDSPTIRKLVELSFRGQAEVVVEFAETGRDGIAKALRSPPDVILLDFVLPDMKGTDVCRELSRDGQTMLVPVLLVTAKGEQVREQFRGYPSVVDYVVKPFTAADIVTRVRAAANRGVVVRGARVTTVCAPVVAPTSPPPPSSSPSPPPTIGFKEQEAVAQALFTHLRSRFAQIPTWMSELGATPPSQFFARRILTRDLMELLVRDLLPVCQRLVPPPASAPLGDGELRGQLDGSPLLEVLRLLERTRRTGELRVRAVGREVVCVIRDGRLLLVRSTLGEGLDGGDRSDDPGAELEPYIDAARGEFSFRATTRVTPEMERPGTPLPLAQLALEQLRRRPARIGDGELAAMAELAFERTAGFSGKVRELRLDASERRVLSLADGHTTARTIAERASLPPLDVAQALARLVEIELIRRSPRPSEILAEARRVMILEPDVEGFQRPLADFLREREEPMQLVDLSKETDIVAAIRRDRPCLVVINATHADEAAARTAAALCRSGDIESVSLAATVEAASPEQANRLRAAGFHAVLQKPVQLSEIEELLW